MTLKTPAFAVFFSSLTFGQASPAPPAAEIFAGNTPCGALVRDFLGISASSRCERVSWRLHLLPGRFEIEATHGMQAVNDLGFAPGFAKSAVQGTRSTAGPMRTFSRSVVHTLTSDAGRALSLALVDDALMHALDAEGRFLRGDGGWSYTLTRTVSVDRAPRRLTPLSRPQRDLAGDFEGRTACRDLARLLGFTPAADCTKLKWGLTLQADGTYTLEGTLYRTADRKGSWAIRTDSGTGEVIYILDPSKDRDRIALLRASADVLFFLDRDGGVLPGTASFSYTLNRSDRVVTSR